MTTDRELALERVRRFIDRHEEHFGERFRTVAVVVGPNGENYVLTIADVKFLLPEKRTPKKRKIRIVRS